MPGAGNPANYSALEKSQFSEETPQPPIYQASIIPKNDLNICPYTQREVDMSPPCLGNFSFNKWRPLQKPTTNQNAELSSLVPIKMQSCRAPSQWDIYKILLHRRLRKHCGRREWKECKRQRVQEFAVRLCLLLSEALLTNMTA